MKNLHAPRALALAFIAALILIILGALQQSQVSAAPMAASVGPNFAGTATSAHWGTPANGAGPNDNVCATEVSGGPFSIDLTNFSFSIPAGSTITGILVEPKTANDNTHSFSATLLKAGAPAGIGKTWASSATLPVCTFTTFASLGGIGDLWSTTWTPSDINATNFGVRVDSPNLCFPCTLDAVRITVLYDPPAPPAAAAAPARPAEVPEADTLLLMSGGLGGLATWLAWRWRARKGASR